MSLNLNALAPRLASAGVTAEQALTLAGEIVSLVGVVEQLYTGLKGDVKLKAVLSGLDAVIDQMGLSGKVDQIRAAAKPLINLVVTVLNGASLWSQLFKSIASVFQAKASASGTVPLSQTILPVAGQ